MAKMRNGIPLPFCGFPNAGAFGNGNRLAIKRKGNSFDLE
jgi:hypothetical protein